jgi:tetratricopeptide (TPR) repeat protein
MTTVSLTLSQVFEFALKAYHAGKFAEAEQLCLKILSADPASAPTLNLLAVINSALGRNDAALSNADRALSLRPDFVEALVNRAIALRPDHADALVNRGNALDRLRRHEDALASCSRATTKKQLRSLSMLRKNPGPVRVRRGRWWRIRSPGIIRPPHIFFAFPTRRAPGWR